MGRKRDIRTFAGDFETTVYQGQEKTEVWSAALVELGTEEVFVYHSIGDFFKAVFSMNQHLDIYFHNLKFDGTFILSYLINELHFMSAFDPTIQDFPKDSDMPRDSFKYLISDMGQWYTLTVSHRGKLITFKDSLKLLPFSLARIGKAFKTKHQKLEMEYTGFRYAGCEITPAEMEYIKNDVLVLKEALEFMFDQGHKELTIGSCCLKEFRSTLVFNKWDELFPNLYEQEIDADTFGTSSAGLYVKKAYRGGWCYVVKGKEDKVFKGGCTADVNSLYPSMMHSESGNIYPVGAAHFWKGAFPDNALRPEVYYFVRIKTRFYLKKGFLPFVQIKNTYRYKQNECLETSDIRIRGEYFREYLNPDGSYNDGRVTLTLTKTDFELMKEHYDLEDCEILDGCWFVTMAGVFDAYIDRYKKLKQESKGAMRELAKLFLNNLYGKMATSTNKSFKVVVPDDEGVLHYEIVYSDGKKPGYIACGAAIPSYARAFTIRAAQANYYGPDKPGFIYADTDSIHCDLRPEELRGIRIHDKDFCAWKVESEWSEGYFNRQKTYIELLTVRDGEALPVPFYNIKCAGMSPRCKYLFNMSITGTTPVESVYKLTEREKDFVSVRRSITDFRQGLRVPGKLMPRQIPGGTVLVETDFTFR